MQAFDIKLNKKKETPSSTPIPESVPPIQESIPVNEVIPEETIEKIKEADEEDTEEFDYDPYTPDATEKRVNLSMVSVILGILIVGVVCALVLLGDKSISIYHTPIYAEVEYTESGAAIVNIDSKSIKNVVIDVYKGSEKLDTRVVNLSGTFHEVVLQEPGDYIIHAAGASGNCVSYGITTVSTIGACKDFSDLTALVKTEVIKITDPKKSEFLPKLKKVFAEATIKDTYANAIIAIRNQVREILGFDEPTPVSEEYQWQDLFGRTGVISIYMEDNKDYIDDKNFVYVMQAIAEGLEEK